MSKELREIAPAARGRKEARRDSRNALPINLHSLIDLDQETFAEAGGDSQQDMSKGGE